MSEPKTSASRVSRPEGRLFLQRHLPGEPIRLPDYLARLRVYCCCEDEGKAIYVLSEQFVPERRAA